MLESWIKRETKQNRFRDQILHHGEVSIEK